MNLVPTSSKTPVIHTANFLVLSSILLSNSLKALKYLSLMKIELDIGMFFWKSPAIVRVAPGIENCFAEATPCGMLNACATAEETFQSIVLAFTRLLRQSMRRKVVR